MDIYSTVQSRCFIININNTGISVHRNFSIDGQSRHFACFIQAADDNANGGSYNTLPFQHYKENDPCYGNQSCGVGVEESESEGFST